MADEPKNPYPPGSARAKYWARLEAERRAKEEAEGTEEVEVPETEDDSKRRGYLDRMIEGQTTDGGN